MIDNNNNFYNKLILFWSKLKRQGFTLAEALIITVMTGYCLLPILGTMQNAQSRTQEYDHQSKMQLYTRSRLTEEIANAAFENISVNTDPEYHYIIYLARGTSSKEGKEADATLIELPKTTIEPDEFKILLDKDNWNKSSALDLIDMKEDWKKPYLKIEHIYKTTVETSNTPPLEYDGSTSTEKDTPKALLGIVVKTCLLESNGDTYNESTGKLTSDETIQVAPLTLFSFVNQPVVSDETIWLADALNCKIYGVDPISRGINSIQLPIKKSNDPANSENNDYRPLSLAVHPNLKILACLTKKGLYLINIEKKGKNYGEYHEYYTFSDQGLHYHDQQAYKFIKFRPDGKYLFISPIHGKGFANHAVAAFEITCSFNSLTKKLDWDPENATPKPYLRLSNFKGSLVNDKTIVSLLPANDGYLYVAYKDKSLGVIRFPMYSSVINDNNSEWLSETIVYCRAKRTGESAEDYAKDENNLSQDINSIDVSPDGNILAITAEKDLYLYNTRTGEKIISHNLTDLTKESGNSVFEPNKVTFSAVSNKNQNNIYEVKDLILTVTNKLQNTQNVAYVFYYDSIAKEIKELRNTKYSDNKGGNIVINSPENNSVVITDQEKSQIYFGSVDKDNSEDLISETNGTFNLISNNSDNASNTVDIATNKRDVLAMAAGNKIKLYDLNTFKEIDDSEMTAVAQITSLSMNPQGNMLLACHGRESSTHYGEGEGGITKFHLTDFSQNNRVAANSYCKKSIFDDRTPNMPFALNYPAEDSDSIVTNPKDAAFSNIDYKDYLDNGGEEYWETNSSPAYDRSFFTLNKDWHRLDMIGMPNGGAMVLYGKDDGSSMLEWIGRRNWAHDPYKGKYKLFARWTNVKSPSYSIPSKEIGIVSGDVIDGDQGTIIRLKEKFESNQLPSNVSIRTGIKASDGNHEWGSEYRYITALLLEQQDGGGFNVVAKSNPLRPNKNDTKEFDLTWIPSTYDFNSNKTYYLAFWHGTGSNPNKGVVAYSLSESGSTCISDLIKTSSWENSDSNKFSSVPNSSTTIYDPNIGGVSRNYAIKFRCQSYSDNFPPGESKKIAISPDCKTLGILSGSSSSDSILSFYDFNNQLYGPESQIEGMVVDYRQSKDSGAASNSDKTPVRSWPIEDESLFEAVASFSHFNGLTNNKKGIISSLASATTKFDTWTSFNDHPANYWFTSAQDETSINGSKSEANKRFIGYYRPGSNRAYLQRYGKDEPRFFLNKNYIGGRYDDGAGFASLSSPLDFKINENENGLLQIDEASNAGEMHSAVFVAQSAEDFSGLNSDWLDAINSSNIDKQFYRINSTYSDKIDYINSSETYILKNTPNLIYSLKAKTNGSPERDVGVSDVDMLFSRDKSNPIIYILDKTQSFIWAYGRYNNAEREIVNEKIELANTVKSNLAISSDGQKLILATDTQIVACDISLATPSLLIGATATITVPSGDKYLATKPYCSFSSSSSKGDYRLITNNYPFIPAMNGAITVASGGVYLFDGNRSFLCYNPISNIFTDYSDVLKKTASYSPIVTYDDTIYVFGSDNGNIDDTAKPTDRIQSFNPTTGESLSSLDSGNTVTTVESDYFLNSINCDYSSFRSVEASSYDSGFGYSRDPKDAFDTYEYPWISANGGTSGAWIKYTNNVCPFIANGIKIYNTLKDKKDYGTKHFYLVGVDSSNHESEELVSGTIPKNSYIVKDFTNNTAYKSYKIYCDSSYNSNKVGLSEIYLYRNNVQRLTPPQNKWSSISYSNKNYRSSINIAGINIDVTVLSSFYDVNYLFNSDLRWQSFPDNYVKFSFSTPVKADILRYADGTSDQYTNFASKFSLYGSNTDISYIPTNSNDNGWIKIKEFSKTKCSTNIMAYELDNTTEYKYYLFRICELKKYDWEWHLIDGDNSSFPIKQLELWSEVSGVPTSNNESPSDNYLTALVDDNLNSIKVGSTACCSTPYGLVMAGGHVDGTGSAYATNTTLLYWPHAINKYNGTYYESGIPRSLPPLKQARFNHVLVWHKGKIYAIGGAINSCHDLAEDSTYAEYLDYNHMPDRWNDIPVASYTALGDSIDNLLKRFYHGACSFGDEIYVFGGRTKEGANIKTCFAWNPETGYVRTLEDLPAGINSPYCAVACGSKIYIAGNDGGSPANLVMYEYTP